MYDKLFNPAHYFGDEFYLREKKLLFSEAWHLAGIKPCMNLVGNRYYCTTIAGKKIQLRAYDDVIYALENVCPHRGGPFVLEDFGEEPLVCKYHGLAFTADGCFRGTKSANWFCGDRSYSDLNSLKLKSFRVKEVGDFVFVSLGETIKFEDQFNEQMISEMSSLKFHSRYGRAKWTEPFNWKLNFENIKDPLHTFFVHPNSFANLMKFDGVSHVATSRYEAPPHPLRSYRKDNSISLQDMSFMSISDEMKRSEVWYQSLIENQYNPNRFVNFYMFPSTNFYSVGGTHFCRQTYDPVGARSFDYTLEVYLPILNKPINAAPLIKRLLEIEKSVIDEDSIVLKRINDSFLNDPLTTMAHGDYEDKILSQLVWLQKEIYANCAAI
jgi:phenylpropionate dioxygenase-like ring-hydroxylating dioxygenase large terminal subunit